MYLETARVRLDQFAPDESHLMLELDSDPEVMRYLNGGRASTLDEVKGAFERTQGLYVKYGGRFGVWKATEKSTGEYMGWFIFRPCKTDPENLKEIELGYRLKKKFWGAGFATEVSRALVDKGFKDLGVEVAWAKTTVTNLGSQAVMKKLGMIFEKNFDEPEILMEDKRAVRFSISKSSWKA